MPRIIEAGFMSQCAVWIGGTSEPGNTATASWYRSCTSCSLVAVGAWPGGLRMLSLSNVRFSPSQA
ncbi:hypothetical protein [Streptomyces griseus]|uniref:hypothetical protein n=1 Tax=Streptomyces griseus TaxID=1911 RepID=UPI0037A8DD58